MEIRPYRAAMMQTTRALTHPPTDIPVLNWWARDYDHVFAVYNPFFTMPGHHPATSPWRSGPGASDRWMMSVEAEENFANDIKHSAQPLRWAEVCAALGLHDKARFDRSVWLWCLNAARDEGDAAIRGKLARHCRMEGIYAPEYEGLPPVLEPMLARYLARLGVWEITLWDEFREVSMDVPTEALERGCDPMSIDGRPVRAVSAPGFMLSWGIEEAAGVLALSDELYRRGAPSQDLECRPFGPSEYADVFNPVHVLDRAPLAGVN